jgi:hypothetical protein
MDRLDNIRQVIGYLLAGKITSQQIPSNLVECQRLMRAGMNVWEPRDIRLEFLAKNTTIFKEDISTVLNP